MDKILIWGYGVEGQSNLAYLQKKYPKSEFFVLTDEHQSSLCQAPDSLTLQFNYLYGDQGLARLADGEFNLIVKSPGISLYRPELQQALKKGSKLSSAINLWYADNPDAKTIIVTGTKGKSTTASLLNYLMAKAQLQSTIAGNIGVPILATAAAPDYTIFELSSYQLADLQAQVDCFIVLNLYPEHIPWHGSEEQYYLDKLQPLLNQRIEHCILRADSKRLQQLASPLKVKRSEFNSVMGFHVTDGHLYFKNERLRHNFALKGEHNLLNLAACLTLLVELKVDWRPLLNQMQDFAALPHRMQERLADNGVLYVNDSISTTPDSCYCALQSYQDKKIHLILGGDERGLDYHLLLTQLAEFNIQSLSLIGTTGQRISEQLAKMPVNFNWCYRQNLSNAMQYLKTQVKAGECVLLSPAAPSFDQFKNYQARGDLFNQLIQD
ncbi:UDP-N-acetylmuramoyl-L-alanine--D-glutamate ligase [Gayadomonas joobiniege]|uniref:UDP-N-acetylmuramoyl-L-alanine--D-glutamate ligase n=1 Tax=Gayadomonas joobiniege TaxID=1234606 RepID=UPI000372A628|nr:UDP-N-acetylmuramoyl-L-alanine--D-glutamate ligase [Gayadomonas joobiniege]